MKKFILASIMATSAFICGAQKYDYTWLVGIQDCQNWYPLPAGNTILNFNAKPLSLDFQDSLCFLMGPGNTTMANRNGELLFFTNTKNIKNLSNVQLNNEELAPSQFFYPQGPVIPAGTICLPLPDHDSIFYYFYPHPKSPDPVNFFCDTLLLCTIDMAANGGQGNVLSINVPIFTDTLAIGHLTATRHANGRDWWIIFQEYKHNCFLTFLLSPNGLGIPFRQCVGTIVNDPKNYGQAVFSTDGSQYATYNINHDLELLDFDRCSGLLSNPRHYFVNDGAEIPNFSLAGMSLSPNGRFAYISSNRYLYQLDLKSQDIQASLFRLDTAVNNWATHQNGPDGRTYITSTYSMQGLHLISRPNELQQLCLAKPMGLPMVALSSGGLPNHPNFRLGPLDGSACDTLGLDQALATHIDRLDFGQVQVGQDSVRTLWLSNPGEAPLEVTEFYFDSTGFSSSTPLPFTVPPHDSVAVSLTFHPTAEHLYEAQLTMYHNGIFGISTVMLTGEGVNFNSIGSLPHLLSGVSIQPNPSSGLVQVAWPTGAFPQKLIVYDALGRTVLLQGVSGSGTILDGSRLPPGVYTVVVEGYWPVKWVVE